MQTITPQRLGSWIVIAVLSVITLILYVDNKRTRQCIADYMVKDQNAAVVRFDAADEERQLFKVTLKTLISGEADATKRRQAIDDYIVLLDKNDAIRKQNPLLPVPTECD